MSANSPGRQQLGHSRRQGYVVFSALQRVQRLHIRQKIGVPRQGEPPLHARFLLPRSLHQAN